MSGFFPRLGDAQLIPTSLRSPSLRSRDLLRQKAEQADLVLLFNPRRLSTFEWVPTLTACSHSIALVSDYWLREYPDCDQLWQTASKHLRPPSPLRPFAKTILSRYGKNQPDQADLSHIKNAAFVSRWVQDANLPSMPNLRRHTIIHNGIELDDFPLIPMTEDRWNTWGFCGRLQPEKGVELALDLFRIARRKRPGLRFLIAGDVQTRHGKQLRQNVQRDPELNQSVTFLGQVPNPELSDKFYRKVGVLLFTSLWPEPFALTVIEAMASGTLVLATPTGGTPEVVTSETGILLKTESPEANADVVGTVASSPSLEFASQMAKARERTQDLSISSMANQLARMAGA